jgi:hypothetical protein
MAKSGREVTSLLTHPQPLGRVTELAGCFRNSVRGAPVLFHIPKILGARLFRYRNWQRQPIPVLGLRCQSARGSSQTARTSVVCGMVAADEGVATMSPQPSLPALQSGARLLGLLRLQGPVAQSGERRPRMAEARGSSPLGSTPLLLHLQEKRERSKRTGPSSGPF